MSSSLLEQLPKIVAVGRRRAAALLDHTRARHHAGEPINGLALPPVRQRTRDESSQSRPDSATEAGSDWTNWLADGDCLRAMAVLLADEERAARVRGKVDLIHFEPTARDASASDWPHASQRPDSGQSLLPVDNPQSKAPRLTAITSRLVLMRELLSSGGSLFVRMDWSLAHPVKLILDNLFGEERFRGDIVLQNGTGSLQGRPGHLLWYARDAPARFPSLWIQNHDTDGPRDDWHHFWSTANAPAKRYTLFGIAPTIGQWLWHEARAMKAVRNYERFCLEGAGRSIAKYWQDTGATLEFVRSSPEDGVPQYWQPFEGRVRVGTGVNPDETLATLSERNEALMAQLVDFACTKGAIVAGFEGNADSLATVAERLDRRWLVAGLNRTQNLGLRKRLIDASARPFLLQTID